MLFFAPLAHSTDGHWCPSPHCALLCVPPTKLSALGGGQKIGLPTGRFLHMGLNLTLFPGRTFSARMQLLLKKRAFVRAVQCANVLGAQSCESLDTNARWCCVQVVQKKHGLTTPLQRKSTPETVQQRKNCRLLRRNKMRFVIERLCKTHNNQLNVSWFGCYLFRLRHKNQKSTPPFTRADEKKSSRGRGCVGESYVGEMHTHPENPCKHAITRFFSGGYCLPTVHPCVNYPLSFYGASAVKIYGGGAVKCLPTAE